MSSTVSFIGSSGSAIAASLTSSLLASTSSITTSTPEKRSEPYDVPPPRTSTKQTVILSVVFAGWAIIALMLFVLIARRRGKFLEDQDLEAMVHEQHVRGLAAHTPFAHMPLETEHQSTRHTKPPQVFKKSELELLPVIPASDYMSMLSKLQRHDGNENPGCAVCLENLCADDSVRVLECGHGFHPSCIDKWLLKRSCRCPLCNRDTRNGLGLPSHPSSAKLAS
ncbi:hypothetical protein GGI22_001644 [Coemansia erecta]|nr:hypothetical protein GGI22_001644 [Coemansia erecta]